jgi:hypothetical protein
MKTVILRTYKRTKSNSFSDADHGAICWSVNNESDKTDYDINIDINKFIYLKKVDTVGLKKKWELSEKVLSNFIKFL